MQRYIERGFSLVESLITVALLALFSSVAIPSLNKLIDYNRSLVLADELQSHLAQARALSISRNRDVEICGSSDGEHCDGGWDNGWLIYIVDEMAAPVSRHVLNQKEHLRCKNKTKVIRFHSNGTSPLGNTTFLICDAQAKTVAWQLTINRQGRVRRQPGDDAPCS